MLNPTMKAYRLSKMTTAHVTAYSGLSSTGQSLATVAVGLGVSQDDAEKRLSLLVDESLAARTTGSRTTARYNTSRMNIHTPFPRCESSEVNVFSLQTQYRCQFLALCYPGTRSQIFDQHFSEMKKIAQFSSYLVKGKTLCKFFAAQLGRH